MNIKNKNVTRETINHKHKILIIFLLAFIIITGIGMKLISHSLYIAKQESARIYKPTKLQKARNVDKLLKNKEPISILLMGTDTGALGRTFKGRTDTMIVCVLNPKNKTMYLVSLPRDSKVAVNGYEQYYPSKLNSAYEYGSSTAAVQTVQKYLNVPIDFYATINMGGIENLINAVGGIDISPLLTFSYDGYYFTKDKEVHLNGKAALAYCRMRYTDPQGDYGRQNRQRQVLMQLAFKSMKLRNVTNDKFVTSLSKQLATDINFKQLIELGVKYRVATHNMKQTHLQGQGELIDGQSFEVPSLSEKQRITNYLRNSLELENAATGSTLDDASSIDTTPKK